MGNSPTKIVIFRAKGFNVTKEVQDKNIIVKLIPTRSQYVSFFKNDEIVQKNLKQLPIEFEVIDSQIKLVGGKEESLLAALSELEHSYNRFILSNQTVEKV